MLPAIDLPAPGAPSPPATGGAGTGDPLGALGALLHYVFRHAGVGATALPDEVLLLARAGAPVPAGVYRYDPGPHCLLAADPDEVPTPKNEPGTEAEEALLRLVLIRRGDRSDAVLGSLLRQLLLAAAELDLAPWLPEGGVATTGAGAETGRRVATMELRSPSQPAGDRALDHPAALVRHLLTGRPRPAEASVPPSRLQAMVEVAARTVAEPLFVPGAWEAMHRLAAAVRLPCRDLGLECRLAANATRIDLAAAVETRLWGAPTSDGLLQGNVQRAAGWQALDRFAEAFGASPSLRRHTRHLGVELDADGAERGAVDPSPDLVPAPGLFVGLADGRVGPALRESVHVGLAALLGEQAFDRRRPGIDAFLDALPERAIVHYFGAFAGRETGVVRFNVQYPDRAAARAHHSRQGYAAPVTEAVDEAHELGARVVLAYDVGAAPRRLGIELLVAPSASPAPLLDALVTRGLCSAAKREAVLAWPRVLQEPAGADSFPSPLRAAARRGPDVRSVLVFKLSHLKWVVGEEGEEAKAYLQLQHAWVPASLPAGGDPVTG